MTNSSDLHTKIVESVDENSGGLKLTQLLVDLMEQGVKHSILSTFEFVDMLEDIVDHSSVLGRIEYISVGPPARSKTFIFRKALE